MRGPILPASTLCMPTLRGGKTRLAHARGHIPSMTTLPSSSKCPALRESKARWSTRSILCLHCQKCPPRASTSRARAQHLYSEQMCKRDNVRPDCTHLRMPTHLPHGLAAAKRKEPAGQTALQTERSPHRAPATMCSSSFRSQRRRRRRAAVCASVPIYTSISFLLFTRRG